jgi:hypothetical protein
VVFEGSRENHFFFDAASAPLRVDAVEIVEVVDAALDMVFVDDLEEVKGILLELTRCGVVFGGIGWSLLGCDGWDGRVVVDGLM